MSATVEDPAAYDYHGHTVLKCWTVEPGTRVFYNTPRCCAFRYQRMDPFGADFVHTVVEAAKLAYGRRESLLWRSNFHRVPLGELFVGWIQ